MENKRLMQAIKLANIQSHKSMIEIARLLENGDKKSLVAAKAAIDYLLTMTLKIEATVADFNKQIQEDKEDRVDFIRSVLTDINTLETLKST